MRRIFSWLAAGFCCAGLLTSCGASSPAGPAITVAMPGSAGQSAAVPSRLAGKTALETTRAYVAVWEAEDGAALEQLLTPGARAAWALAGGTSKWLLDGRGGQGDPLAGQGRVLLIEEPGSIATAHVALAYRCNDCSGERLADWPPAGSVALAGKMTLERAAGGSWLNSYLDGSSYLAGLARATSTAYAASQAETRTTQDIDARAAGMARSDSTQASRTAQRSGSNATATALWAQWFAQPTQTPVPAGTK